MSDKDEQRFERNMSVIHAAKLDYKVLIDKSLKMKTNWGIMIFYPRDNHFVLESKKIYGNAKRMIEHLKINKMI